MIANRVSTGGISVSTIHKGRRVQKTYFGYRVCVAKKQFKKYLKTLKD